MSDLEADLRDGFEAENYDVASVSVNRDVVTVALLDDDADSEELRRIAIEAGGGEGAIRSVNVSTEALDGRDQLGTVVSFRHAR